MNTDDQMTMDVGLATAVFSVKHKKIQLGILG